MFISSWEEISRLLIVGPLSYIALIVLVRVAGKRSLAKMNSYDLVVTVALGSMLATILLNRNVPLSSGLAAIGLLLGLQYCVSWLAVRSHKVRNLLTAEPTLLYFQGTFLRDAMRRERVTEEQILTAIRNSGGSKPETVWAVVLETSGEISCILK